MKPYDERYFDRYYEAATAVTTRAETYYVAKGITAMVEWVMGDISSVLEIGAGPGYWRDWFRKHRPRVPYRSTDASRHACRAYGHELRDVTAWRPRQRFDVVVCAGVLECLGDEPCERAIDNLAHMTATFLYANIATGRDLETIYRDPDTDPALFRRTAAWYRKRMKPHFIELAFGLWLRRGVGHSLGELDCGG